MPVLGATASQRMGLITVNRENIGQVTAKRNILDQYKDVFNDELGHFPDEVHLEVDPTVQPVITAYKKSANGIPFNTVQYRSVPFNTIEDINGKFVGLNDTLNGKKDNARYTIEHLKYRSVPFNYRSVPFSVIENVNGKCIGLNGKLIGKKLTNGIPLRTENTIQYHC